MFPLHRYFIEEIISFPGRFQIFIVPVLSLYVARNQCDFWAISGSPSVSLWGQREGSGGCVIRGTAPQSPFLRGCTPSSILTVQSCPTWMFPRNRDFWTLKTSFNWQSAHRNGAFWRQVLQTPWPIPRNIFMKAIFKSLFPKFAQNVFFRGAHYIMHSGCSRALNFMWL